MKLSNSNTVEFLVLLGQHYLLRKQLYSSGRLTTKSILLLRFYASLGLITSYLEQPFSPVVSHLQPVILHLLTQTSDGE